MSWGRLTNSILFSKSKIIFLNFSHLSYFFFNGSALSVKFFIENFSFVLREMLTFPSVLIFSFWSKFYFITPICSYSSIRFEKKNFTKLYWCSLLKYFEICLTKLAFSSEFIVGWYLSMSIAGVKLSD